MDLEKRTAYFIDLGRIGLKNACEIQSNLVRYRKQGKIPDVIMFAEHPPTISFGLLPIANSFSEQFLNELNGTRNEDEIKRALDKKGYEFHKTERGGGATYLGPGQVIVYPIVDYEKIVGKSAGIGDFKLMIDRLMRDVFRKYGLKAEIFDVSGKMSDIPGARSDRKDVWVESNSKYYKIGGKGLKIEGNISYHGFNFYVTKDSTRGFSLINPCGYSESELGTENAEDLLGEEISLADFKETLLNKIKDYFKYSSIRRFSQITEIINLNQ